MGDFQPLFFACVQTPPISVVEKRRRLHAGNLFSMRVLLLVGAYLV